MKIESQPIEYAIRFGLGAIKSVGHAAMEEAVLERKNHGKFKSLYDFVERIDAKFINKKSIEALAKSGSFDSLHKNRQQIAQSYEILAVHGNEVKEQKKSNQMSLFSSSGQELPLPELKKIVDWSKAEKLQMEFESFGYFLNEHPLDNSLDELKSRGIVFSNRIEDGDLEDNSLIKMSGVVASSKHRSSVRGRFAYLNISDPFGIFEATIFDEAVITANRDLLSEGCEIVVECLIKKGEGGFRLLVRSVSKLQEFIGSTKPAKEHFEDVKILPNRSNYALNKGSRVDNRFTENKNQKPFVENSASQQKSNSSLQKTGSFEINSTDKNYAAMILNLKITDKSALLPLKTILMQKRESRQSTNKTKIYLVLERLGDTLRIELGGDFYLAEVDFHRLKNLHRGLAFLPNQ